MGSNKMELAREWHASGGFVWVALQTRYGRKVRGYGSPTETRQIVYRVYESSESDENGGPVGTFVELTKYQAKRFVAPDIRAIVDDMEPIMAAKKDGAPFRDAVELNQKAGTCARTKQLCDAIGSSRTIPLPSLAAPYATV